jgi:NTE family protein
MPETRIDLSRPDDATQLTVQSIIANKLKQCRTDILVLPAVSKYRVLDFLKIDALMNETADIKDELKRQVEKVLEARGGKGKRGKRVGA